MHSGSVEVASVYLFLVVLITQRPASRREHHTVLKQISVKIYYTKSSIRKGLLYTD